MPRPRSENGRDRLLEAGLALFAELGTERVHSNAIARRAGLGVGTFYSYFRDKHDLLHAIELRTLSGLQAARASGLGEIGPDPVQQLRASVVAAIEFAARHPEAYRVTFGRERSAAKQRRPIMSESIRPTAAVIRQLRSAGQLAPDLDPDLASRAYLAMEVGLLLWWLEDPSRATASGIADTLCRLHPLNAARPR